MLPDGKDSLKGKLGLVLVGKTVGAGAAAAWCWSGGCGAGVTSRRYPTPKGKGRLQQDGRRDEIVFRIKPHTRQRYSKDSNIPIEHQDPETPQGLRQNCECLLWRYESAVDCCRGRASGCSRPGYGISPLIGGHYREGNGNPLQYSCLENPTDGGAL